VWRYLVKSRPMTRTPAVASCACQWRCHCSHRDGKAAAEAVCVTPTSVGLRLQLKVFLKSHSFYISNSLGITELQYTASGCFSCPLEHSDRHRNALLFGDNTKLQIPPFTINLSIYRGLIWKVVETSSRVNQNDSSSVRFA
jgi:hypothetical protein